MAHEVSKIERLGLAPRVARLMVEEGITVGREIGRILRKEGVKISDAAVNRYLAKVGRVAKSTAEKIIQEHVDRVVPDDLAALEEMEALCLKWSKEETPELAERIAAAKATADFEVDDWVRVLSAVPASDIKARAAAVKEIIKRVVDYIAKDDRMQDKRIRAMAMAHKIIETKLSKAGLLKDEGKGKIVIVESSREYDPDERGEDKNQRKPLVIRFAKKGQENAG